MSVSAQDVKKLREMTGAGMMDCKEALGEARGDFEQAVDILRKKGLSRAAKKAGRETKEGVIAAYVRPDEKAGSIVEINCETDFVARTDEFQGFVKDTIFWVDSNAPQTVAQLLELAAEGGKDVRTALNELIGKLGENMQIARVAHFAAPANARVHTYIHPGARVGVLIEAAADKPGAVDLPPFRTLVHDLAMQVAAAQARFVRREDVDGATLDKEREIARAQMKDSGKPPQVVEKIVEGKLNKFYEDACLVDQLFIKDQNVKVRDLLQRVGQELGAAVTVNRFVRYALGEGL